MGKDIQKLKGLTLFWKSFHPRLGVGFAGSHLGPNPFLSIHQQNFRNTLSHLYVTYFKTAYSLDPSLL